MKFGLSDKTIEAIQDVLSQHRQIGRAVIYGSRAKEITELVRILI